MGLRPCSLYAHGRYGKRIKWSLALGSAGITSSLSSTTGFSAFGAVAQGRASLLRLLSFDCFST
ncbi:hypothetical protein PILCRDRAFT_815817, partial [Piloderma croceum F 1598]